MSYPIDASDNKVNPSGYSLVNPFWTQGEGEGEGEDTAGVNLPAGPASQGQVLSLNKYISEGQEVSKEDLEWSNVEGGSELTPEQIENINKIPDINLTLYGDDNTDGLTFKVDMLNSTSVGNKMRLDILEPKVNEIKTTADESLQLAENAQVLPDDTTSADYSIYYNLPPVADATKTFGLGYNQDTSKLYLKEVEAGGVSPVEGSFGYYIDNDTRTLQSNKYYENLYYILNRFPTTDNYFCFNSASNSNSNFHPISNILYHNLTYTVGSDTEIQFPEIPGWYIGEFLGLNSNTSVNRVFKVNFLIHIPDISELPTDLTNTCSTTFGSLFTPSIDDIAGGGGLLIYKTSENIVKYLIYLRQPRLKNRTFTLETSRLQNLTFTLIKADVEVSTYNTEGINNTYVFKPNLILDNEETGVE